MNRRDWLKTAGMIGGGLMSAPLGAMNKLNSGGLSRADFGKDFQWGVATAAYQIEGAHQADGKGLSVWDAFSHKKGKIKDGANGDVACNFFHSYPSDLELMRRMNIPNYRFSLSWPRIIPQGSGQINNKGLDFYKRVIDTSLEKGITPWATLYHWDLPQALEEKGGWTNRDVLGWFSEYADLCTRTFGDRVKNWMVLNEPMAFVGLGYLLGIHAPGRRGIGNFLPAVHHAALSQGEGGRIIRANVINANIGTTFSASHLSPVRDTVQQQEAVARVDALWNRLFLEPALGLGYPIDTLPPLRRIYKYVMPGDEDKLRFDFDFIGLQNYTREVVRKAIFPPVIRARFRKVSKRGLSPEDITEMGWEVHPEAIYHLIRKFDAYPQIKKIMVTENGAAFPDHQEGKSVKDPLRTRFIQNYLGQVLRARQEGAKVEGYFIWTFMDNFEWAEGYHPRFGIVHVDFQTQERVIKDSGYWFKEFLAE